MDNFVHKIFRKFHRGLMGDGIVDGAAGRGNEKYCLVLYLVEPFRNQRNMHTHQNQYQILELVRIISEFGFHVDVMNFNDRRVRLEKQYELIFDLHPGLNERYRPHLSPSHKKVAYITGSNPSVANLAERKRIQELFLRRRVRLKPRRQVRPFTAKGLESFDAVFFIGNRFNLRTYNEFELKNVHLIKNTGYDFLKNDDFSRKSPRNFLFLGGSGQVHKGLDRLLEVFSRNEHLHLYVCSAYELEKDFRKAYRKELCGTKNIHPKGLVDIRGDLFRDLCRSCSYCVLPSCAEGISGSVLTCMSAGLIPIVSRECGLEEDEVHCLEDCSMECIESTLNAFSDKDMEWIVAESRRNMEIVRSRYSPKDYSESVRNAMKAVLQHG